MKTEQQYFEKGKSIQAYMDEMSKLKQESMKVYNEFELPQDDFISSLKQQSLRFLVITEDWCGDAMMINPVIRKISEAADMETRVTLRDADTDLIDRHLTNGGRAIPIVLILSGEGELIGKWGPRAPEVQQIVNDLRAMITALQERYVNEPQLWTYVYESFKNTLKDIL
ncbi:thioredoxin family protein [Gracilibacillus oryzae]|uniref:Thioredoxin family protein n=1 Tax=Gracilibacillus oryzae TaxID=1672701 RepID=A0A7C8GTX3_9BACI|nr:thioredoxin family protein [Gracilibacillus oryzae]KAB8137744.1 thioredoxin family protein [Gracilibacillus oryzae]